MQIRDGTASLAWPQSEGGRTMATDPDIQRELEANQRRKRVIDQNEGK